MSRFRSRFGVAILFLCCLAIPQRSLAEQDSLICTKIKDTNKIIGGAAVFLGHIDPACKVGKSTMICQPTEVESSDDPLGSAATEIYACFKAKCPSSPVGIGGGVVTRFGTVDFPTTEVGTTTRFICVPTDAM